jgi:hypothetical protein
MWHALAGKRGLRQCVCSSQSPSRSLETARPVRRASALGEGFRIPNRSLGGVTIKTNIYFTIDEIGDTLLGHHMAQPRLRLDLSSEAARRVVKMFAISASCSTPLALQTLTQMLTRAAAL